MIKLLLAGLLSLSATFASAQPQSDLLKASFENFSGGLNDLQDPTELEPQDSPDLLNVVVDDPAGSVRPRLGYSTCGRTPSGNVATGLFSYSRSDGTARLIVSDGATHWQTADCVSFSTITTGLDTDDIPDFAVARDILWIVNGATHTMVWNGTTQTLLDTRASTPNPAPAKGNYIEFWKERVWIARTAGAPSSIFFNSLTNAAGDEITPSTGSLAWPAINEIVVDEDGGCPIYGIKPYRDRLFVFKGECGIWRIAFNNDADLSVAKTLATVGTRFNTSIVEIDGLLNFVGPDGIYAFDGDTATRISSKIPNKFAAIRQPRGREGFKLWTSLSDWNGGTSVRISTTQESGAIMPADVLFDNFNDGDYTAAPAWTIDYGAAGFAVISSQLHYSNSGSDGGIRANAPFNNGILQFDAKVSAAGGGRATFNFNAMGISSGDRYLLDICYSASVCSNIQLRKVLSGVASTLASGPAVDTANHTYRVTKDSGTIRVYQDGDQIMSAVDTNILGQGNIIGFDFDKASPYIIDNIYVGMVSSATWTSPEYNRVLPSSWTTFEVTDAAGSGSIAYTIRTATGSNALTHATYQSITDGSVIPGGTHYAYAQVLATFSASTETASKPTNYDITLNYTEGEVSNQPIYGLIWKNRYWISAASGTATDNNMVLVRSKSDVPLAWVPYDLNIGPMANYRDSFYAAASTHSAIFSMDTGNSDSGGAIPWHWTSRDESFDRPFQRKRLLELIPAYRRGSADSVVIGYSNDSGATWSEKTVDMSGSGRSSTRLHTDKWGRDIRFRVSDNSAGETATLLGIHAIVRPSPLRE